MPANNFQPMTCVPEVSLLDPNEILRSSNDDKISYKLWKKHKSLAPKVATTAPAPDLHIPAKILDMTPPSRLCCEDRIRELSTTVEQQQAEMDRLRTDNFSMQRDLAELRNHVQSLSQAMDQLKGNMASRPQVVTSPPAKHPEPLCALSGRWSLPGSCSDDPYRSTDNILVDSNTGRQPPPPDKSQMLNNLFHKYFPASSTSPSASDNVSPSNVPILEYNNSEGDKSMATMNYLNKYRLLSTNERVLDISKLKKQSKLMHQ